SVVSAPGPVTFANPSAPTTAAQLQTTGTYVLRVSAGDGELSSADEVTVVLQPANLAPVVNAGPDQRVLSLATTLAGSVSDDGKPLGGSVQSTWGAAARRA